MPCRGGRSGGPVGATAGRAERTGNGAQSWVWELSPFRNCVRLANRAVIKMTHAVWSSKHMAQPDSSRFERSDLGLTASVFVRSRGRVWLWEERSSRKFCCALSVLPGICGRRCGKRRTFIDSGWQLARLKFPGAQSHDGARFLGEMCGGRLRVRWRRRALWWCSLVQKLQRFGQIFV